MVRRKTLEIMAAVKRAEPKKKRFTFFLSIEAKEALASWCLDNSVSESGAIEAMLREIVPNFYFKRTTKKNGSSN